MRAPSRTVKYHMKEMVGESDYLLGLKKDLDKATSVKNGMESSFGAAIYIALEGIERDSIIKMEATSPLNILEQINIRSTLRVSRYIKNVLDSYIINREALELNMKGLEE